MPEAQWDPLAYYDFPLRNDVPAQAQTFRACANEFAAPPFHEGRQIKRAEALSGISRSMRCGLGIPEEADTADVATLLHSFDHAVETGILFRGPGKERMAASFLNICERALSIRKRLAGLREPVLM